MVIAIVLFLLSIRPVYEVPSETVDLLGIIISWVSLVFAAAMDLVLIRYVYKIGE